MSCPNCFSGHVRDGAPSGREEASLYGLPTYVAEPRDRSPTGVVVIIPDAFGWKFVNNRILADHYADRGGWKVLLPEFMDGTAAPTWMIDMFPKVFDTSSLWAWVTKPWHVFHAVRGFAPFLIRNRLSVSLPRVVSYMQHLRGANSGLPIGAAGFCWGGRHIFYLARPESLTPYTSSSSSSNTRTTPESKPLVDALFTGHPSALELPHEAQGLKVPVSVAVGTNDKVLTAQQQAVLKRELLSASSQKECEVRFYEGAGHGFCVRADPSDAEVEKHCAEAETQAVEWFARWFAAKTK